METLRNEYRALRGGSEDLGGESMIKIPGSFPGPAQWARIRITRKQAREIRPETCREVKGPVCQVDPGEVCREKP